MNSETDIKTQFGYFKFKDLFKVLTSYRELKSGVIIQDLRCGGDFFFSVYNIGMIGLGKNNFYYY